MTPMRYFRICYFRYIGLCMVFFLNAVPVTADVTFRDIQRYAPLVKFHPYESYLPSSVEHFRENASAFTESDDWIGPASDNLSQIPDTAYLAYQGVQVEGLPLQDGQVTAPVYVHVKNYTDADFTDVQYFFFYNFNGCVYFRVAYKHGFTQRKRNVPICNFGRHQGDWEHVTVRFDAHGQFVKMFFSEHGTGQWLAAHQIEWEGTHPVVYPSLHSHANISKLGVLTQEKLPLSGLKFISSINWIKFVDVTTLNGVLRYDWMPYRDVAPVWRTWESDRLKIVSGQEDWLQFKGGWGRPLDNSSPKKPPEMSGIVAEEIQLWARAAIYLDFIDTYYLTGKSPNTPSAKALWVLPE